MDVFCKIISGEIPSYTIYEDEIVKVFLDANPTSAGHCLVVPKQHYTDIYDIDNDTLIYIFNIAKDISKFIMDRLGCEGISFCQNNGIAQEVKHFHLHIIPKYDKNKKMNTEEVYYELTKETE